MSNEDAAKRQRYRELRGKILRTARLAYGKKPDTFGLPTYMRCAGKFDFIQNDMLEQLQYLVDLGFLEKKTTGVDALDTDPETVWRLTGKGMQILNGDAADPSIEL